MCAARLDETVLINTQGSSRKAYRVWLEEEASSGRYHVCFAYGRIGSTLREGRKTELAMQQSEAARLKQTIVREKVGRGYVQQRQPKPAVAPPTPPPAASPKKARRPAAPVKVEVEITVNRANRQVVVF